MKKIIDLIDNSNLFDIEIEFDNEVVKRIERTKTAREFEKLIESEE